MVERVNEWMELATERLADSEVPLYLIPAMTMSSRSTTRSTPRLRPGQRRREGS